MKQLLQIFILLGLGILVLLSNSYADGEAALQFTDPSRISTDELVPPKQQVKTVKLPVTSKTAAKSASKQKRIRVNKIVTNCNEAFTAKEMSKEIRPIKRMSTIAELTAAADKITKMYQDAGYALSKAILPEQVLTNGVVEILIIEGYINSVTIDGPCRWLERKLLNAYAKKLTAEKPVSIKTIEHYAKLANNIPGINTSLVFRPSADTLGATDAIFKTSKNPFNASLNFNNRGTKLLGPYKETVNASINGLIPAGVTRVSFTTTPDFDNIKLWQLSHTQQLTSNGFGFSIGYTNTDSKPKMQKSALQNIAIVGSSQKFNLDLFYPVKIGRKHNFTVTAGFGSSNSKNTSQNTTLFEDKLRAAHIKGDYTINDSYGVSNVNAVITQGFDLFGATVTNGTRKESVPDFTKMVVNLFRHQQMTRKLSFLMSASMQYSGESLASAEEFGVGGPAYGKAYDSSEIVGDKGIAASLTAQYVMLVLPQYLAHTTAFAFIDGGKVWNNNTSSQPKKANLASAGFGMKLALGKHLHANVTAALPLADKTVIESKRGLRVFFNMTASL